MVAMTSKNSVRLLAVAVSMQQAFSCRIHGYDSGYCEDSDDFATLIPFCSGVVPYRACLPKGDVPTGPADDNGKLNAYDKDKFIEQWFNRIIEERLRHETNRTLEEEGINEIGEGGWIVQRYHDQSEPDACMNAFKNYFCWLNFPRCDEEDESLVMCRSACENLHIACGYDKDLWRCGQPEFYYGYRGEASGKWHPEDNTKIFYRYPYPGGPFRDIQGDPEGVEMTFRETLTTSGKKVCTPSIVGAAPASSTTSVLIWAMLLANVFIVGGNGVILGF